jgi:two-component system, cell cycle sensor histidine kinase and response regulator CckA
MLDNSNTQAAFGVGILLVEDNKDTRLVLRLSLERAGFAVWEAGSGTEAIQVFQRHACSIHYVVSDLPGTELRRAEQLIRRLNPGIRWCVMTD